MSYKPQIEVNGQWRSNGLVFETSDEAEASAARDLMHRWMLCTDSRAIESTDYVNYTYLVGETGARKLINVEPTLAEQIRRAASDLSRPGNADLFGILLKRVDNLQELLRSLEG